MAAAASRTKCFRALRQARPSELRPARTFFCCDSECASYAAVCACCKSCSAKTNVCFRGAFVSSPASKTNGTARKGAGLRYLKPARSAAAHFAWQGSG
ncbi:hypothetical protein NPIL_216711 [Nephila pilipes]|uniref:Uncharacterized protein n=1 Tax=Nephila pilipes TaxID=299642 RepID=A0A8X6TTY1_NEPPI|nr:hypothetical protein NPIL_216711 [Nephila pilipes]